MTLMPRRRAGLSALAAALLTATPALAQTPPTLDRGDTAWMIVATVLVLLMIVPGLALFYGGLVRAKNLLSVLTQVLAITCLVAVIWVIYGYSLAFTGESGLIGGFSKAFLAGIAPDTLSGSIPEYVFLCFQMTFACITTALIVGGIAERNKMTLEQFGQHMKGMGVDIRTMKNRFKAEMSWREVVRRRFGHLISITERDVDQLMANTSVQAQGDLELQVQRITFPLPGAVDQSVIAQRIAEADAVARKFSGCASLPALAANAGGRHEDLGSRKPATIPEPTRSLLLNARDGDLLPASVSNGGVELWALCGRKAENSARENAQAELRQQEFDVLAQKHLKDLRQDASIEIR